jgi:hypothetical protein
MTHSHLTDHLTEAVFAAKQEALLLLLHKLMTILKEHNYSFDQLIEGLASYAETQPGHEEVVGILEKAGEEASRVRRTSHRQPSDRQ